MAHVGRRLGQGLVALGVLFLLQPAPSVGAARHVTAIGVSADPEPAPALGQPVAPFRTAPAGHRTPPPGRLPEPAGNRAYGLPVALAIVGVGGVLSLLVRLLLAEGSRQRASRD